MVYRSGAFPREWVVTLFSPLLGPLSLILVVVSLVVQWLRL